jgi:hypothetical protein
MNRVYMHKQATRSWCTDRDDSVSPLLQPKMPGNGSNNARDEDCRQRQRPRPRSGVTTQIGFKKAKTFKGQSSVSKRRCQVKLSDVERSQQVCRNVWNSTIHSVSNHGPRQSFVNKGYA